MTDISITDSTFDISVTSSYYMSIQANLNGLSFCILDPVTNKYIALVHKNFDKPDYQYSHLNEYFNRSDFFKYQYKKIFFLYHTNEYALIPAPLHDENRKSDILHFNGHKVDYEHKLISNRINMCDSVNTFAIPMPLYEILKSRFADIKIFNQSTPRIESALIRRKSDADYQFLIHVQDNWFEITATDKHNLILQNSFNYNSEKDLIYMLLFTFEQLKIQAARSYVEINGNITASDLRYKTVKKYLRNAIMAPLPPHFLYSENIQNVESQYFANLFNLTLCV